MRRRKFLLASGSAILTGSAVGSLQQPSLGLDFEISGVPKEDPENVDSILIKFTQFELTPQYLDPNKELDITAEISIDDSNRSSSEIAQNVGFTNGETLNLTEIESRSSSDISNLILDNINPSGSQIDSEIVITVNHPDIRQQKYNQSFTIVGSADIVDNFNDGTVSSNWNPYQVQSGPTESGNRMRFDLATDKRTRIYYDNIDYRDKKVRAEAEIKHENLSTGEGRPQIAFGFVDDGIDWYGLKATHDQDNLAVTYSSSSGSESNNIINSSWTYNPFWVAAEWYPSSNEIRFYTATTDPTDGGSWTHQYTDSSPRITPKYPAYWGDDGSASTEWFRIRNL